MIPGFEDGIVGMSAGDQKSIDVTFPDDYSSEELQGADAAFAITCKSVKALELAPLDEELFASYGVEEGGEEFLHQVVDALLHLLLLEIRECTHFIQVQERDTLFD